jgi:hypothetical protein
MQTTNDPTPEPGTTAGSHLKQERNALESKTEDARDEAKQKAHQAYDELRQETRKIARESGSYLKNVVAEQQHLLVEKLEEYRDAAKAASEQLKSEDDTVAAKNIRKAARGLECVADYVRESEPNDLLSDASRMARKRPELVFGGLFLAGLGMARVMKASARERRSEEHSSNGGPSSGAGDIRPFAGSNPGNRPTATPAPSPAVPRATIGGSTPTPPRYE